MKLLFTRLQEEITTVKKSVTQFRVETNSPHSKTDEFPVIEITPEPQRIEHGNAHRPLKTSRDDQKAPLSLNAKAEHSTDVVDLQGISKKGVVSPVTYSARKILNANPYPGFGNSLSKPDNDYSQKNVSAYLNSEDAQAFSSLDERRVRYQYAANKFISTQEMIEHQTAKEKRVLFELTI